MAWQQGLTRQQRGYGRAHEKMRKHLMQTVIVCEHCRANGRATPGTHADHIVSKAKGGTDDRSNYQLLCASCHALKSVHDKNKTPRLPKRRAIGLDGWAVEEN